ncbi:hypothetical protein G6F31_020292 [Rhizopus arrhizus]|nr:hypothetical protein G6F31_020292 [Rhizopus arrhizus]
MASRDAEVQRHGDLEERGFAGAGEVQAAHGGGGDVADRQRQDERGAADPDARHAVQQDDGAQHQARQRQVFCAGEGAVGHGAEAAAHADQADLDERV